MTTCVFLYDSTNDIAIISMLRLYLLLIFCQILTIRRIRELENTIYFLVNKNQNVDTWVESDSDSPTDPLTDPID